MSIDYKLKAVVLSVALTKTSDARFFSEWFYLYVFAGTLLIPCAFSHADGGTQVSIDGSGTYDQSTNSVDLSLYMHYESIAPSTLVVYALFDKNLSASDSQTTSTIRLDSQHQEKGYRLDSTFFDSLEDSPSKSCLAFAIYNPSGTNFLSEGSLCSLQFNFLNIEGRDEVTISFADDSKPVVVSGRSSITSAASHNTLNLPIVASQIIIPTHCTPPPSPKNVTATCLRSRSIKVSWEAPETTFDVEYKVFRGITDSLATCIPVTEYWIDTTVFVDALSEEEKEQGKFYYRVAARFKGMGCSSNLNETLAIGSVLTNIFPFFSCHGR